MIAAVYTHCMIDDDFESLAFQLEQSPDYRVLRRVIPRDIYADPIGETRTGIILDTETTGLNRRDDQVIELAMLAFSFDAENRVCRVTDRFQSFNDPSQPISAEITKLTGITDDMVAGQAIDPNKVAQFISPASVVIAHNAAFDRPFAERIHPMFATKAWACSVTEIPWGNVGITSAKLDYLAMRYGLFHDGHRGLVDCEVLLEILARPFPGTETSTLKQLLDTAREPTWRLWALDSPFEMKDLLKARGYRWSDGTDGSPRSWYRDVTDSALAEEKRYLSAEIYPHAVEPHCVRMTAFDRFADR